MAQWNKFLPLLLFAVLSIIWGSSFILIKKSLLAFSPLQVASLRILFASIAFSPWIVRSLRMIKRKDIKFILLVGFTGSAIPALLYAWAQTHVDSSIAGILNSMTPIFTLIFSALIFSQRRLPLAQIAGVILGFGGVALIVIYSREESVALPIWSLVILVATMMYGLSGNIVQHKLHAYNAMIVGASSFAVIGVLALIALMTTPFIQTMQVHPMAWTSLLSVTVLSLTSTFLATVLFYWMLKLSDAIFASAVSYFIPIVALTWGVLDGERLSLLHVLGFVIIMAALYMIHKGSKQHRDG